LLLLQDKIRAVNVWSTGQAGTVNLNRGSSARPTSVAQPENGAKVLSVNLKAISPFETAPINLSNRKKQSSRHFGSLDQPVILNRSGSHLAENLSIRKK